MGKRASLAKKDTSPSPKAKKAKADPVKDAVQQLLKFFKENDAVPKNVKAILQSALEPALSTPAPDRNPVMQIFATAINETLTQTINAVDTKAKDAEAGQAQATMQEAQSQQAATAAEQKLKDAQAAVTEAQEKADAADTLLDTSEKALKDHQKEESQLGKTKSTLDSEFEDLAAALATAQATEAPPKKEVTKLVQVLKKCEGSNKALLDAAPSAIGSTEGFATMVVGEICKVLSTKKGECEQKIQQWDAHVANMNTQGEQKTNAVAAAKEQLDARQNELTAAEAAQTAAQAEKKAPDKARTAATQAVNTVNEVAALVQKCVDARALFDGLYSNKGDFGTVPEADAPAQEA